jgi:hypothetical protein
MINDTQKGKANINNKQKGRVVDSYKLTVETNVWENDQLEVPIDMEGSIRFRRRRKWSNR